MSDELWPTSNIDFEKRMKDIHPRTARQFKEMYMGDPPTVDRKKYEIAKEYYRYEDLLEELLCPIDTHHGPMPATSEQRMRYNRGLNTKERSMREKYGLGFKELREIIKQHRDIYEKFREQE